MVRKHCEFHGCRLCATWGKQEKADLREQTSPLGSTVPVQGVYGWIVEEMCPYSRRGTDHREMPYCSVWRPLWSFQNTSKKSGKVVSSGPQCMKTPENLFEGAEDASYREASLLATQCPSHIISKLNYLMSGV